MSILSPERGTAPLRVHMLARKRLVQNTRIFKQAESLARAGYEVTVIGVLAPGSSPGERRDDYTIVRIPAPRRAAALGRLGFPLRWLSYYLGTYRLVTRGLPKPAVIHCNDLDTLPVGLMLARRLGVPVVYDVQDLYAEQDHIPRWARRLVGALERRLIARVQSIIVVNDAIGEVLTDSYGVEIDAVVLNCPPLEDRASGRPAQATLREALQIPDDRILVVYSGGLEPHRGLENVVLSLLHLDAEVNLALLGEGTLRERLQQIANAAGLGRRVFFHKFVPHLEVPRFISSADIGIVPYEHIGLNHYLCSPSKLFHYIMAELPVVCSDFPFLRTVVIGNGIGSAFDPGDPGSIAMAIREVIDLQVATNGLQGRVHALKRRYCWEEEEKRLFAVYTSLTPGLCSTAAAPGSKLSIGSHGAYT